MKLNYLRLPALQVFDTRPWGGWDRNKLMRWFPPQVVTHIMRAYPPSEERGEDKYFWKPSSDGCFTVNSAYHFLFAGLQEQNNTIWSAIWRWQVPEKVKTFMWIFAHGRSHTCCLRYERGCADSPLCPFACL